MGYTDSAFESAARREIKDLAQKAADAAKVWEDTDDDGTGELQKDHVDFAGGDAKNVGALDTDEATIRNTTGKGEPSANQSIPSGSSTTVNIGNALIEHDAQNVVDVDTQNNQLVVKRPGTFDLKINIEYLDDIPDGTRISCVLKINGTRVAKSDMSMGGQSPFAGSAGTTAELSAGDNVTLTTFQNSGSSKDVNANKDITTVSATVEG